MHLYYQVYINFPSILKSFYAFLCEPLFFCTLLWAGFLVWRILLLIYLNYRYRSTLLYMYAYVYFYELLKPLLNLQWSVFNIQKLDFQWSVPLSGLSLSPAVIIMLYLAVLCTISPSCFVAQLCIPALLSPGLTLRPIISTLMLIMHYWSCIMNRLVLRQHLSC